MIDRAAGLALAADDAKVRAGMKLVESGAKQVPNGKIGEGRREEWWRWEFQASTEALQGMKVGGRIGAVLREAPKCP